MYAGLKHSHMLFITVSIILFQWRYFLKMRNKPLHKTLKILPHINDTLLLVTGVSMAYIASINPMVHPWLAAKIIALLLYIVLGMVALKSAASKSVIAYLLATATFVFMVMTAIVKTPYFLS
jgi:uncharacterized membrane protein SirB2